MFVYASPSLNAQDQRDKTQALLGALGASGAHGEVRWLVYRPLWVTRGDYASACRRSPDGALAMFIGADDAAIERASASLLSGLDGLQCLAPAARVWRDVTERATTQQRQVCQSASGGSFFAQLELTIEPSMQPLSLSRIPEDERDLDKRWAANLAIEELAHEAAWLGLRTGHLTLSEVRVNLVDFKPQVYRTCARCALRLLIDAQPIESLDKIS